MPHSESQPPSTRRLAVTLTGAAERAARGGHPWIFADGIKSQSFEARSGTTAVVFDRHERVLGVGLWDATSQIRLRMLGTGRMTLTDAWLRERLDVALARRQAIGALHTGWRAVYGESDALPGLVVDRYADTAVIKLYTSAWHPWLPIIAAWCTSTLGATRVVLRMSRNMKADPVLAGMADGLVLVGEPPADGVVFEEYGLRFRADVVHGQKTGFFLDQRETRHRVGKESSGQHVLNAFSYTGGFSVHAGAGGARSVLSLDLSKPALTDAEANWQLNVDRPAVRACDHQILAADAFVALVELARQGRRFGIVVLDPPAFAKRADEAARALDSYRRLTQLGLALLAPGGLLVTCSCSRPVPMPEFVACVRDAAETMRRPLRDLTVGGHPEDHPTDFAELTYLKSVFARA